MVWEIYFHYLEGLTYINRHSIGDSLKWEARSLSLNTYYCHSEGASSKPPYVMDWRSQRQFLWIQSTTRASKSLIQLNLDILLICDYISSQYISSDNYSWELFVNLKQWYWLGRVIDFTLILLLEMKLLLVFDLFIFLLLVVLINIGFVSRWRCVTWPQKL